VGRPDRYPNYIIISISYISNWRKGCPVNPIENVELFNGSEKQFYGLIYGLAVDRQKPLGNPLVSPGFAGMLVSKSIL
jgi:hypothetical protein